MGGPPTFLGAVQKTADARDNDKRMYRVVAPALPLLPALPSIQRQQALPLRALPHWLGLSPSVPSDFTGTIAGNRALYSTGTKEGPPLLLLLLLHTFRGAIGGARRRR